MAIVWRSHPITASQVMATLSEEKSWAANTVRTMLARLVKKGALEYEQEANRYLYRPAVQREECVEGEVDSLLQRVFGGAAQPLLVHFLENTKLRSEEIRALRNSWTKRRRNLLFQASKKHEKSGDVIAQ